MCLSRFFAGYRNLAYKVGSTLPSLRFFNVSAYGGCRTKQLVCEKSIYTWGTVKILTEL